MKRLLALAYILLILAACGEKSTVTEEEIVERICLVTLLEGEVSSNGSPIEVGDNLSEEDTVRTGEASVLELQLGDSSLVRIKENSELKIVKLFQDVEAESTKLFLKSGKLLANPEEQREGSTFEVETESVTLGVRGTEFVMISDEEGTRVAVKSGKVAVKNRMDIEALERVKELDPELASSIEKELSREVTVGADEKLVVDSAELEAAAKAISLEVEKIAVELESAQEEGRLDEVVDELKEQGLEELSVEVERVVTGVATPEEITEEDSDEQFGLEEFDELSQKRLELKEDLRKLKEEIEQKKEELERVKQSELEQEERDRAKREAKLQKEFEKLFDRVETLIKRGELDEALSLAASNLARAEQESGESSILTAIALQQMGWCYRAKEESYELALQYVERSISLHESLAPGDNLLLAYAYSQHGELLYLMEDFNRAEEVLLKLLDYLERGRWGADKRGELSEIRGGALQILAGLAYQKEQFEQALSYIEQALPLLEVQKGKESPELVKLLEGYMGLLRAVGRDEEAGAVEERIASIKRSSPDKEEERASVEDESDDLHSDGPEETEVQDEENIKEDKELLAEFEQELEQVRRFREQQRFGDAVRVGSELMDRAGEALGWDTLFVGMVKHELAISYMAENRRPLETERLLKETLAIYEKRLEPGDAALYFLYGDLVEVQLRRGLLKDAKALLNRALEEHRKAVDNRVGDKKELSRAKVRLLLHKGELAMREDRPDAAERDFAKAIAELTKLEGEDSPALLHPLNRYKEILDRAGKKEESRRVEERIVRVMENSPEHKKEAGRLRDEQRDRELWDSFERRFRNVHRAVERGAIIEAIRLAEENVELAEEEAGKGHEISAIAMMELADLYFGRPGRMADAEHLLEEALGIVKGREFGPDGGPLGRLYSLYAEVKLEQDDLKRAEKYFKDAIAVSDRALNSSAGDKKHHLRIKARSTKGLADILFENERFVQSEGRYREALKLMERVVSADSEELLYILEPLIEVLEVQGKGLEARRVEERIERIEGR